jgi:hypothetical protein
VADAVAIGASVRRSFELTRARLWASLALGAGVVLSLVSLCCGIGALMAPWILCELLALQLGQALGTQIERNRSWFGAGAVLLAATLLVGSVGWVTWLGLGTDPISLAGTAREDGGWTQLGSGGAWLAAASSVVSWLFVLPFLYTPLILLATRATLGSAVLESARLVATGGAIAHFRLAFVANVLQVLPLLAAAALATLFAGSDRSALWMLFSLPAMALTLPLGQGMIVASFAGRGVALADLPRTRLAGQPPWMLVVLWAALVTAPLLSFGMLGASLVRPSHVPLGTLPVDAEPVGQAARLARELRVFPPGTALEILITPRRVQVTASDGGGAGSLPLRSGAPIEAARVVRVRERYGIELTQAGQRYATWIDRAGVRLDDDLQARLLDRVPSWALLGMLGALLAIALALLPVLAKLGELRRLYTLPPGGRPPARELSRLRTRSLQIAGLVGLGLSPLAALSLYWGARSLLGE